MVGAGSVVTRDVGEGALAVARGEQAERPGWAVRFRAAMAEKKKAS
jgi:bifunctional UDP-N-acetylglucosamine pyrophosphorylase/glucosamine-1-phosphate N-acetyltransferase